MNIRPEHSNQRQTTVALHGGLSLSHDSRNIALRWITIVVVTIFWIGQFGANTLYTQVTSPEVAAGTMLPRGLVCVAGALITFACIALQDRWRHSLLRIRAYWAIAFTIVSAAMLGALNHLIFEALMGPMGTSSFLIRFGANYPMEVLPRLWVFGSVYAMALAISYSSDLREREEEIVALRSLAQDAQIRALRSQLNPHFLFNALNSIAALIREGRTVQAEETTEHLADFLRIVLSLDPQQLITVTEEVSLQRIYLDIQKVRFPKRLQPIYDIAAGIEDALVPNLILQPLVENSVKYAVARSTAPVTVRIQAAADGEKLHIVVEDDGGNAGGLESGMGSRVGLANVAERLAVHFGGEASLVCEANSKGGFRNSMLIPLRRYP